MAKEKEKKTAHILFVNEGKTRKEIAQLVGVTEKTVGDWVQKFGWVEERAARTASPVKRSENIKAIITSLSEERIELSRQIKESELKDELDAIKDLRERISRIDDSVSKWNKVLMNIDSENKITLSTYISVMERIFDAMRLHDAKLFMHTVEFQEEHLHRITMELG